MRVGDVFISYARDDDRRTSGMPLSKGFVTALHELIADNLNKLGPPKPALFRDTQQIGQADQFEPRLGQALDAAKLLVVVLSRNWMTSEWCTRELEMFVEKWRSRGETDNQIKERILLVLKHAIDPDQRPPWVQGQSGFPLVNTDPENGREIELFDSDLAQPLSEDWFKQCKILSNELRIRLQTDSATVVGDTVAPAPVVESRITVYLAQPAADMRPSYETLRTELTRRGIAVVPSRSESIPTTGAEAIQMIDASLAQAVLSIHLVGEKPGFQPDGAQPIVQLQLDRAARLADDAAQSSKRIHFQRLIWVPRVVPNAAPNSPSRDPFAALAAHAAGSTGDKVEADTLAKFTQFVVQYLDQLSRPSTTARVPAASGAQVYVQHSEEDASIADTLADSLVRLGFVPRLPILDGRAADQERDHRDALSVADAVVLCWASAPPIWVRSKAIELRAWRDLGRRGAFHTRAVVAFPPQTRDKERLRRFHEPDLDAVLDATETAAADAAQLDVLFQSLLSTPS